MAEKCSANGATQFFHDDKLRTIVILLLPSTSHYLVLCDFCAVCPGIREYSIRRRVIGSKGGQFKVVIRLVSAIERFDRIVHVINKHKACYSNVDGCDSCTFLFGSSLLIPKGASASGHECRCHSFVDSFLYNHGKQ